MCCRSKDTDMVTGVPDGQRPYVLPDGTPK
jgi:hypothetical protein